MKSPQTKIVAALLALGVIGWFLSTHTHAQLPSGSSKPAAAPAMDAEKEALWNSPEMLRARAWLTEYCNTSAKCKPGDAQKFTAELQNMSLPQMQLWLMKFEEEEAEKQQQNQFWKHVQGMAVAHAKSVNKQTDQSLAAINTEETAAANQEQQQLNYEQQLEDTEGAYKQLEAGDAFNPGAGYYPGDGVHFHFHLGDP